MLIQFLLRHLTRWIDAAAGLLGQLEAGPRHALALAVALHGNFIAEQHGHRGRRRGLAVTHLHHGDAAANADHRRGRLDQYRILLAEPTADKAHQALAGGDHQIAGLGLGIVDEAVELQFGIGADGQAGAVDEQQMGLAALAGADHFVGEQVDADGEDAILKSRRPAQHVRPHRRRYPDFPCLRR